MADREPPQEHVSVQEAARRLDRSEQNIRDRIKSETLAGTHDIDESGRMRYWVRESAVAKEEARIEAFPRVRDVRDELDTVSAAAVAQLMGGLVEELGRQNAEIVPRLEAIASEIQSQREDVTDELRAQRQALLSLIRALQRMEHRQMEIINALGFFREEAEKDGDRQEKTIIILQRTLEVQERIERKGFWSRLFGGFSATV